jgi:carboxyl-terminal processing protease
MRFNYPFKHAIPGFIFGAALTGLLAFGNSWEVSKNLEIFSVLMREIDVYYVDEINPGELTKTAMDAMLEKLDPYTVFIPESEIENHRMSITGRYGGIGAVVRKRGEYITIMEPYENSPAAKAGILPGDKVLEVEGQSVKGKATDEVVRLMKGQPQTAVSITIERAGKKMPMQVIREEIKSKNVPYYGRVDNSIGYIKLSGFTENAAKEVRDALEELKAEENLDGLILDLRGNPGGLLREAIHIVNIFVERGQVVVTTKGKVNQFNQSYRTSQQALDTEIKLVVLVNRRSASASEIVSGSIQDLDRGIVLGQRTFGKGLVQTTRPLVYNNQLKITTAKYYIPSGRCVQALDYKMRRENGSGTIPDSLRTKFKTSIGRTVFDGVGIYPDIAVKPKPVSNILRALVSNDLIFDFANAFRLSNEGIVSASDFTISDQVYKDLLDFLSDKSYDYTTESEKVLERFREIAEREQYFDQVKSEFEQLETRKSQIKKQDVHTFRAEIERYLRLEIVSRYYFRKGRIASEIKDDPEVREAVKLLRDKKRYTEILSPGYVISLDDSNAIDLGEEGDEFDED